MRLALVGDITAHPLRTMIEHALVVTVNSDDPAYFGGYLNDNYRAVQRALGLTKAEVVRLARNSFAASFLTPGEMGPLLAKLDEYVATF